MRKLINWFRSLFCRREFIDLAIIKQLENKGITPLFHINKNTNKRKVFKVKRFKISKGVK